MKKDYFCRILAFLIVLAIGIPAAMSYAAPKDTVRVGISYDPSTVNMLEMKTGIDIPVILTMHEGLMATDRITGKRIPGLAESIQVMPNPKDIKIKIRKGARFHTGEPVTAADVKWTYQQCMNPQNTNMMAGPLDDIESIDVLDDHTLVFHFYEPYAAWQELMWIGICSKKYYDSVGPEKFRKNPVGSGVFKFVERKVGESVTLAVDQNYWDVKGLKQTYKADLPNFKYLQFVTVPDDQSRLAMLETGELDIVGEILPHQLKSLQKNKRVRIKRIDNVPSLFGIAHKTFADPIMKDKNFGHAIMHAINRQEIVDKIFLGEGYPLYMYASKTELGYDPKIKFEFNPQKAKEYLKKSSYKPGYPIVLTYTNIIPNAPLVAASIQQYLQNIGITVKLRQLEGGTAATYNRNRDPQIGGLLLYSWAGGRDPSLRLLLSTKSTSPYAAYPDRPRKEEMNALIDAQARELDVKKRAGMLKKIHEIILEYTSNTSLYGLNMIYATSDRVEYNWTPQEAFIFNLQFVKVLK